MGSVEYFLKKVLRSSRTNAHYDRVCVFDDRKVRKAARLADRHESSAPKTVLTEPAHLSAMLSLAVCPSILAKMTSSPTAITPPKYTMFSFEPFHNLHIGVAVLLKSCLMTNVALGRLLSHPRGCKTEQKRFISLQTGHLRAWHSLLALFEDKYLAPGSLTPVRDICSQISRTGVSNPGARYLRRIFSSRSQQVVPVDFSKENSSSLNDLFLKDGITMMGE